MEWLNLGITMGVLIVSLAIAWGKIGTKIALVEQSLKEINTNHLKHIEIDMREQTREIQKIREALIRLEEKLNKKII